MITYRVTFEITIADTDSAPSDWLVSSIDSLLEEGESLTNYREEELTS